MLQSFFQNLILIGLACGFLAAAITANTLFGAFYNVKKLQEHFQPQKLLDTLKQLLVFALGLSMLAIIVTGFIPYLQFAGLSLDVNQLEYINITVICLIFSKSIVSYTTQAINKINKIIGGTK